MNLIPRSYDFIDALMATVARHGVGHVCIGAGSRSTILLQALQSHAFTIHPFFDERAVGFMALGLAKTQNRPVMIITTSGSAVSNLGPAITEAAQGRYQLIACTADRPIEYYGTSANQTIRQSNIFNHVVKEIHIQPSHTPKQVIQTVQTALHQQAFEGGPIHINCPLPDPVVAPYAPSNQSWTIPPPTQPSPPLDARDIPDCLTSSPSWLCIGALEPHVDRSIIRTLVTHLNWPTIVDGTNHWLKDHPHVIHSPDDAVEWIRTTDNDWAVLYLGGAWISKRMAGWLADVKERVHHVSPWYPPVVPLSSTHRLTYDTLLQVGYPIHSSPLSWVDTINQMTATRLAHQYDTHPEPRFVMDALATLTGTPHDLFIGNSLPIRYVDPCPLPDTQTLYCNRGASGIDGNIATIIGLSLIPTDVPLLAIVGDLTALYDLNAFLLLPRVARPLTIIVLNNAGGGIFKQLPIAQSYEPFDEHFTLSHRTTLTPILCAMGVQARTVHHVDESTIRFCGDVLEYTH